MVKADTKSRLESELGVSLHALILCGGSGTRLWPLSRKTRAKQFLHIAGPKNTLLQATIDRLRHIVPPARRWIVTTPEQAATATAQAGHGVKHLVVEPEPRNTAAAIALSAWKLLCEAPDSIMVVVSADHCILNVRSFEQTIADAARLAHQGLFVTIGIQPSTASTSFGYIERGLPLDADGKILAAKGAAEAGHDAVGYSVRSFREKPNQAAAEQFLRTGRYLWNAGIFVWQTRAFWNALSHVQPELCRKLEEATPETLAEVYASLPNMPIDVAFLEQTSHVACVPAQFDWNDVGSWSAVRESLDLDHRGNAIVGDVVANDCRNCLIHSNGVFVAAIGLEDIVIVSTPDALLVAPLSRSQDVKQMVAQLEAAGRKELI